MRNVSSNPTNPAGASIGAFRGEWSASNNYFPGDTVTVAGQLYVANQFSAASPATFIDVASVSQSSAKTQGAVLVIPQTVVAGDIMIMTMLLWNNATACSISTISPIIGTRIASNTKSTTDASSAVWGLYVYTVTASDITNGYFNVPVQSNSATGSALVVQSTFFRNAALPASSVGSAWAGTTGTSLNRTSSAIPVGTGSSQVLFGYMTSHASSTVNNFGVSGPPPASYNTGLFPLATTAYTAETATFLVPATPGTTLQSQTVTASLPASSALGTSFWALPIQDVVTFSPASGNWTLLGSVSPTMSTRVVTSGMTLTPTSFTIITLAASQGSQLFYLPQAANNGTVVKVVRTDSNFYTSIAQVSPFSAGETIAGTTDNLYNLAAPGAVHTFTMVNSVWYVESTIGPLSNLTNASSSAAYPPNLVARDNAGNTEVATPTATAHAANKGYVDQAMMMTGYDVQSVTSAPTAAIMTWYRADPTTAAFTILLPSAPFDRSTIVIENTGTANNVGYQRGTGGAGDAIEGSTSVFQLAPGEWVELTYDASGLNWYQRRYLAAPTAGTTMRRDVNGRAQVAAPSANGDITNKAYVDASYHAPMVAPSGNIMYTAIANSAAAAAVVTGVCTFVPFDVGPRPLAVKSLLLSVTTAQVAGTGTLVKGAIYQDNGTGSFPLTTTAGLLAQTTFSATATGTKTNPLTSVVTLPPGRYWIAFFYYQGTVAPTTAPQFTCISGTSTSLWVPPAQYLQFTKYLYVSGLTDLPTASQAISGASNSVQNPLIGVLSN